MKTLGQADAGHAVITPQRTHDLTHKHRSTPRPPLQQDAQIIFPASRARERPARSKVRTEQNETRGESRNGPKLLRRHARIRSTTRAASTGARGGAPSFLVGEPVHTDFVTRNSHGKRFHSSLLQIPPWPTLGALQTGCSWSAATYRRVRRLAARSGRSRPCACEHKRPVPGPVDFVKIMMKS